MIAACELGHGAMVVVALADMLIQAKVTDTRERHRGCYHYVINNPICMASIK